MSTELPSVRTQDNRHRDSVAYFSLSQTHSFHGKFLWKHWISSRRQKDRSSPSSCLSGAYILINQNDQKVRSYSDERQESNLPVNFAPRRNISSRISNMYPDLYPSIIQSRCTQGIVKLQRFHETGKTVK